MHLTFVRSATLDLLKEDVLQQFLTLTNKIMNKYYEADFKGTKPNPSTDSNTTKRFIQDKYVRKKWVDEDEKDPV